MLYVYILKEFGCSYGLDIAEYNHSKPDNLFVKRIMIEKSDRCVEVDWIESNGNCGGATTLHTVVRFLCTYI